MGQDEVLRALEKENRWVSSYEMSIIVKGKMSKGCICSALKKLYNQGYALRKEESTIFRPHKCYLYKIKK